MLNERAPVNLFELQIEVTNLPHPPPFTLTPVFPNYNSFQQKLWNEDRVPFTRNFGSLYSDNRLIFSPFSSFRCSSVSFRPPKPAFYNENSSIWVAKLWIILNVENRCSNAFKMMPGIGDIKFISHYRLWKGII